MLIVAFPARSEFSGLNSLLEAIKRFYLEECSYFVFKFSLSLSLSLFSEVYAISVEIFNVMFGVTGIFSSYEYYCANTADLHCYFDFLACGSIGSKFSLITEKWSAL